MFPTKFSRLLRSIYSSSSTPFSTMAIRLSSGWSALTSISFFIDDLSSAKTNGALSHAIPGGGWNPAGQERGAFSGKRARSRRRRPAGGRPERSACCGATGESPRNGPGGESGGADGHGSSRRFRDRQVRPKSAFQRINRPDGGHQSAL